jgi:hypothetical protein
MQRYLLATLVGLIAFSSGAKASTDVDFVKARLTKDGYAVKDLQFDPDLKPRHQLSHWFAPIGDLAQQLINEDFVTMNYYDVSFHTTQGFHYSCVAGIGNNSQLPGNSRYVEIKDCKVSSDNADNLVSPAVTEVQ